MVLVLLADRCRDRRFIAYASVPTLMKRANASRSAVREGLDKLIASGELIALEDRTGPRGETYYHLPRRHVPRRGNPLKSPSDRGTGIQPPRGRNPTLRALRGGPNPTPGTGIQPGRGSESNPGGDRIPTPRTVVNQR